MAGMYNLWGGDRLMAPTIDPAQGDALAVKTAN